MKREKYIDIARGIAIILVVMGHCDNFKGIISIEKFSGLFFMPLFAFLSGFFSKESKIISIEDLMSHIKKRIKKLYLFYLKWELIFLCMTNLFFKIGFYSSNISYGDKIIYPINSLKIFIKKILEIIICMGREPFCGAFWFIITLIFIIIGYSIINLIINKVMNNQSPFRKQTIIGIIVFICFAIGCIMNKTISIKRISPAFTLMIFYYLGYMSNYYKEKIKYNRLPLAIISLLLLTILYNFGTVSMNANSFPNGIFLILTSFSGIYDCLYISKKIESLTLISKYLSYIGKNTMPIIALHFLSYKIIMIAQYSLGKIQYKDIAYLSGYKNDNYFYIFYVLIGILFPLLYDYFVKSIKNYFKKNNSPEKSVSKNTC